MSAEEERLNSSPECPIILKSSMDLEMDCSLTPLEETTNRSRSSSPNNKKMSFQPARDRESRPANAGSNSGNNIYANGWRGEVPAAATSPQQYQYYQAQYDPHTPMMSSHYPVHRPRGNSVSMSENAVPLSTISPGSIWPTEAQLNASYGYGIRREDGSITRLYPADNLPPPHSVAPRQGPEGLIIVPPPRQVSPNRRMGAEVMIPGDVVQQLHHEQVYTYDNTQMRIDSIVAHAGPSDAVSPLPPPRRREKIYCDKWIHEGVCAFTQMGCKYKHEMPMDKATQASLGLNHGLPNWYRRAYQVVNLTQEPTSPTMISTPPRAHGSWRNRAHSRLEAATTGNTPPAGGHSGNGKGNGNCNAGARFFGPIAPPASSQITSSSNPYSNLKIEEEHDGEEDEDGDEEDTVTWQGRRS